jgi:hypothetical protein
MQEGGGRAAVGMGLVGGALHEQEVAEEWQAQALLEESRTRGR